MKAFNSSIYFKRDAACSISIFYFIKQYLNELEFEINMDVSKYEKVENKWYVLFRIGNVRPDI